MAFPRVSLRSYPGLALVNASAFRILCKACGRFFLQGVPASTSSPSSPIVRASHHRDDGDERYCFTSKRLADDQVPAVPEAELARTRHHILVVGSVLVVNCDVLVFTFTTSGVLKVSESSIWIV